MRLSRLFGIQILAVLLTLVLAACPAQTQQSQSPDPTPDTTVEETDEPEETEEPEDTEEPEETEEPEDTEEPEETDEPDGGDDDYVTVEHDDAEMQMQVPASWSDTDTNNIWAIGGENVGFTLNASPDIESFLGLEYEVPGVFFAASETLIDDFTAEELLDEYGLSGCTFDGRDEYSDPVYTGVQDFYSDCDGTDTEFAFLAATADDGSHIVLVQVSSTGAQDIDAYNRILETFLAGDLPEVPSE